MKQRVERLIEKFNSGKKVKESAVFFPSKNARKKRVLNKRRQRSQQKRLCTNAVNDVMYADILNSQSSFTLDSPPSSPVGTPSLPLSLSPTQSSTPLVAVTSTATAVTPTAVSATAPPLTTVGTDTSTSVISASATNAASTTTANTAAATAVSHAAITTVTNAPADEDVACPTPQDIIALVDKAHELGSICAGLSKGTRQHLLNRLKWVKLRLQRALAKHPKQVHETMKP